MNKSITIRDVAHRAGVSVSTVSRVISGVETPIAISEETRERVLNVARELSYRPHPGARSLRGKETKLLGMIARDIDDPWFAQLIRTVSMTAKEHGFEMILGHAEADPNEAVHISEMMLDLRYCDGFFLLGDLKETPNDRSFLRKMVDTLPMVQLCRGCGALVGGNPSVCVDNKKGIQLGLDYLMGLGHKRIAFLGEGRLGDLLERQEAFHQYMKKVNFLDLESTLHTTDSSLRGGYEGMKKILAQEVLPTAVFASDDLTAIGAMKAVNDCGFEVPGDISLLGFDDIEVAKFVIPALSTIRQPDEKISQAAMEIMLCMVLENDDPPLELCVLVEPELIVRNSCGPPPENKKA